MCAQPSPARQASPSETTGRTVLDDRDIARALTRIAHEILERNKGARDLVLLGIPTRGVPLAARIAERIAAVEGYDVPVGSLDVTMYRDDLRLKPARALLPTEIPPGGIDGKVVVLVDDVLFSGRTIRAALDALNDVGRPSAVRLAVLVDRGHRELPIRADFVGKNLPTSLVERVQVSVADMDGADAVTIEDCPRMKRHLLSAADLTRDDAELVLDHRRRDALAGRPADQEAARAARPHRGQPVLRGLHAHPDLVRGRGQAAQRRRHQLRRQGLQRVQGREPQGHRAHPRGDGRRRGRRPPRFQRRAAPAGSLGMDQVQRGQRRRRHPRAPHPGAARRVHDVAAPRRVEAGRARGPPGRDRRRRAAQPGGAVQRPAAAHPRRRGDAGRAADAAAGRDRVLAGARRPTTSTRCFPRRTP